MTLINLLPWRKTKRQQLKRQFSLQLVVALGLALIILLISHVSMAKIISDQQQTNLALMNYDATLRKKIACVYQLSSKQKIEKNEINLINELEAKRTIPVELLTALIQVMPLNTFLTTVEYHNDTLVLNGISTSMICVTKLINNLQTLALLSTVKITDLTTLGNESLIQEKFVISAKLKLQH